MKRLLAVLLLCLPLLISCGSGVTLTAVNPNAEISVTGSRLTVNGSRVDFDSGSEFTALTVFNDQFLGIVRDKKTGETRVLTSVAGSVWADMTPDYFVDSDIDPASLRYIGAYPLSDQCFLLSDDSTIVTLTSCAKCTTAKKVADFAAASADLDGSSLTIIGENESVTIDLSAERQTDIQRDAVFELVDKGAYLIDVRDAEDFSAGSVDGAINVPVAEFADWLSDKSPDDTFIVFCQKGVKSAEAVDTAISLGFEKIYNAGSVDALR